MQTLTRAIWNYNFLVWLPLVVSLVINAVAAVVMVKTVPKQPLWFTYFVIVVVVLAPFVLGRTIVLLGVAPDYSPRSTSTRWTAPTLFLLFSIPAAIHLKVAWETRKWLRQYNQPVGGR